jgi:primosomal protein N' (replication factor Y)
VNKTITDIKIIEVQPFGGFDKSLSYGVPKGLLNKIQIGCLVRISLGNRKTMGIVLSLNPKDKPPPNKLKFILSLVQEQPVLNEELIRLARWMCSYYASSIDHVLEGMIPSAVKDGMGGKTMRYLRIKKDVSTSIALEGLQNSPQQKKLFLHLKKCDKDVALHETLKALGVGISSATALVKKKFAIETNKIIERDAYVDEFSDSDHLVKHEFSLTQEQQKATQEIVLALQKKSFQPHLLQGVTGSGKTEVYFKAMEEVLSRGGGVLFLVPEVALAPQTVSRLRSRFNKQNENVVVWHSHLSAGERLDAWSALTLGRSRIVVGARSAVFAPVQNLQLIIIDEEHEPAYKQEENPRYHGRDVGVYRAMINQAMCLLGSATPSLETLYNVEIKKYSRSLLSKRVDGRELPLVHLIDMRKEAQREKNIPILSQPLVEALRQRYYDREQSILFLNRRGFNTTMLCTDCGHVEQCKDCSISMTFHRTDGYLRCHICGYRKPAPRFCPSCRSFEIVKKGHGTQRIEDITESLLPRKAVIRRIDADMMSKKNLFRQTLDEFRKGQIDILVGTQMIAKGLDFPNVTLVGVIDADLPLRMEDFRASERAFQLLTQVSGRAGRGDRAGEVYIQTYAPHAPSIQFARTGDVAGFVEEEMEMRKEFQYPPFRHLVRHVFRGRSEEKTSFYAEQWAKVLENKPIANVDVKGPAPAPLEKVKGYYRYHLFYLTTHVTKFLIEFRDRRKNFPLDNEIHDIIDVDAFQIS